MVDWRGLERRADVEGPKWKGRPAGACGRSRGPRVNKLGLEQVAEVRGSAGWGLCSGLGPRANSLGFERWAEVSRLEELAAGI
jgi:hypothetical protein